MSEQIYVARVTANALAAGRFVALVTGEPVELSPVEAEELLRVAFVVKASKGKRKSDDGDGEEMGMVEVGKVETASLLPDRTATAAAQNAKSRKGNAG
jgi:hypothetical protein